MASALSEASGESEEMLAKGMVETIVEEMLKGRRDFILDGLRRFGREGVNPFSGKSYGEMERYFNDYHPNHRIASEEWDEAAQ